MTQSLHQSDAQCTTEPKWHRISLLLDQIPTTEREKWQVSFNRKNNNNNNNNKEEEEEEEEEEACLCSRLYPFEKE